MNKLLDDGILSNVNMDDSDGEGSISVVVSKAGEVGSFSEEERSRQVRRVCFVSFCVCLCAHHMSIVNIATLTNTLIIYLSPHTHTNNHIYTQNSHHYSQ